MNVNFGKILKIVSPILGGIGLLAGMALCHGDDEDELEPIEGNCTVCDETEDDGDSDEEKTEA